MLDNKLDISNLSELARVEEKISKLKAAELFDNKILDSYEIGTFKGLLDIHNYLYNDIFNFAGKIRDVNMAKGGFRFVPVMYLVSALNNINKMQQPTFDKIIKKYVEMNIAHLFCDNNGHSTKCA